MSEEQKNEAAEATATDAAAETAPQEEVTVLPYRELRTGMIVRVHEKIKDVNAKGEERNRVQVFEGMILHAKSAGVAKTITVQKDSGGVLVEKIYPLSSPNIDKIEVVRKYQTHRKKLSFLRTRFKRKMKEIK